MSTDAHRDTRVDLSGTRLNDDQLKQVVDRLRPIANMTELSLARTQVTRSRLAVAQVADSAQTR